MSKYQSDCKLQT